MRVAVFGVLVAMALRSPRRNRNLGTYLDRLWRLPERRDLASDVRNFACRSNLVAQENHADFAGKVQRFDPDVVILHYVINEAVPRALLIDVRAMVEAEGLEQAQQDGVDLSSYGHEQVFRLIWQHLEAMGAKS